MAHPTDRGRVVLDLVFVALLGAALVAPAVDMVLRPSEVRDARHENRVPEPFPGMPSTSAELAAWPQKFKQYFGDALGLRDHLLGARNSMLLDMHVSPTPTLDVGPTGWLCYRGNQAFEGQRGTISASNPWTKLWIETLERRRARLAARGVRFVFAIAPDKEAVYPEMRPAFWDAMGPTLGDHMMALLAEHTQVEVVDLRPALMAAKSKDRPEVEDYVYYPRGTHWTSRGACAASNAIFDRLRVWYPEVEPFDCAGLDSITIADAGEDSWIKNLYAPWRLRPFHYLRPSAGWAVDPGHVPSTPSDFGTTVGSNPALPSVLFLHDSYGPIIQPFLAQRTSRLRSQWESAVPEAVVDAERPDVVLMIRAERMLSLPPAPDDLRDPPPYPGSDADSTRTWSLTPEGPLPSVDGDGHFDVGPTGLRWTSNDRFDLFRIDTGLPVESGDVVVFEYEVDAAARGNLEVYANPGGAESLKGKRLVHVPLAEGSNRGRVVLPTADFDGHARVRLGPAGTWRIGRLEFQVVPRAALNPPR